MHNDQIERLLRRRIDETWRVERGPVWLTVVPHGFPVASEGWKLHISSRASTFLDLVEALLPALLAEGCPFKLAHSPQTLTELNDGVIAPASVGKAVTLYPHQDRVRKFGLTLAQLLRGHAGPRVLSDRRIHPSAPVYYRYGRFAEADRVPDEHGRMLAPLCGPRGERFDADATLRYRQPPWVLDPFTRQAAEPDETTRPPTLLGGRYQIIDGIRESAQGNVYRATDQTNNTSVVIKQGRAFVAERGENDARLRLRNERRVLHALTGVAGVPRLVDHFRQGEDEFLVTEDRGGVSLARDVFRKGPYRIDYGARGFHRLAGQLAIIIRAIHERGVVMRDLSPNNVIVNGGDVTVLDFGLSAFAGVHLPGGTPGYTPARQFREEPPREADDLYALGMTLLFAATGLDPVTLGRDDEETARTQALRSVHTMAGPYPTRGWESIADLLGDEDQAHRALRRLIGERPGPRSVACAKAVAPVRVTPDLAAEIAANLRADLLREAERLLAVETRHITPYDLNVHGGTAGIGLELIHHREHGPVPGLLTDLARHALRAAGLTRLPSGLFNGSMGVGVFLSEARSHGIEVDDTDHILLPDREPESVDLIEGAAGIGLGHLRLMLADGDPAHLAAVRRCASAIGANPLPESDGRPVDHNAVDPTVGAAHGLAGIVELFIALAERTRSRPDFDTAAARCRELATRARTQMLLARSPSAHPLAASWCQGLVGIGKTLLHGAAVLDDPTLADLASQVADAAAALLPRMSPLGQCCGATGLGSLLIDLAVRDRDERYWQGAGQVADHLLLRSVGPPEHPVLTEPSQDSRAASWGTGIAGFLGFFRRFAAQGGPDAIPLWGTGFTSLSITRIDSHIRNVADT